MVSKQECLLALNFAFIIAASILILVASYGKDSNIANTLPIVEGVLACGVFLLFVAILGLVATLKESQLLTFFYVIILSIIFVLQFFISIACLVVKEETKMELIKNAWMVIDSHDEPSEIHSIEKRFECCGVNDEGYRRKHKNYDNNGICTGKWCGEIEFCISDEVSVCTKPNDTTVTPLDFGCPTCDKELEYLLNNAFYSTGGVGLFVSLCEFLAYYFISGNG